MADQVKISELPITTDAGTGDYIPVVEGGVTKRVQAGAGGGLQADTVPGYGIGVNVAIGQNVDLNTLTKGGLYACGYAAGRNFPVATDIYLLVIPTANPLYTLQVALGTIYSSTTILQYVRIQNSGSWSNWFPLWNASNDGPGSGLDADTVSGYGIGVQGGPQMTGDFDNYTTTGVFYESSGALGVLGTRPFNGESSVLEVIAYSNVYCVQRAYNIAGSTKRQKVRWKTGVSSWSAWYEIYNSASDGNGGQPPSAKEQVSSVTTVGYSGVVDVTSGGTFTIPATGGSVYWEVVTYNGFIGANTAGVNASGAVIGTATTNVRIRFRRIA